MQSSLLSGCIFGFISSLKNLASIWEMYFVRFLLPKTVNELTLPSDQIALENDSITVT